MCSRAAEGVPSRLRGTILTRRRNACCGLAAVVVGSVLAGCGNSASGSKSTPAGRPALPGAASASAASGGNGSGGNGEASKPAAQVLADTKSALFNASSVLVTGTVTQGGKSQSVSFVGVGQDTHVTLTGAETRLQLIKVGSQIYVNAPATFWSANGAGANARKVANKWIKIPATQVPNGSEDTLQGLAASFSTTDSPLKPQVTPTTLNGKPAVVLQQADGSKLFVAATGAPVPLEIMNMGASKATLRFEGYGQQPAVKAPAGAVTAQQALAQPSTGTA